MTRLRTFRFVRWHLLWVSLLPVCLGAGEGESPAWPQMRLRLEWGGGAAEMWEGLIEISQGSLEQPRSLGIEADEQGTLWLDDGDLWFRRRSPHAFDGLDVTLRAPPTAVLSINLQSAGDNQPRERLEVRVADLYAKPYTVSLGGTDRRLTVRRAPGDILHVAIDRTHLIYHPGEPFQAQIGINLLEHRERQVPVGIQWRLTTARNNRTLASGNFNLNVAANHPEPNAVPVKLSLPNEEGVYTIRFSATGRNMETAERAVQVVVLSEDSPLDSVRGTAIAEKLIDDFDPANASVFRKVSSKGNLQKLESSLNRLMRFGPEAERKEQSDPVEGNLVWSAYKLRLEHTERPHLLVITVPAHVPQQLGISLVQPNAAGQVLPVGLDSGLRLTGAEGETIEHRVLFWPHVREPVVLFHNAKSGQPFVVSRVQVYELGERLPIPRSIPAATPMSRVVGPYLHKPLLSESFGGSEFFDPVSQRSLDDWETFYVSSRHLVEYLLNQGNNSLMLAVLADGSTLYPSGLLEPSPRYDSGVFAGNGQDPLRKDVVELLFQIFDREGLSLIPELQFTTPLPALERAIREQEGAAEGITLVGRDGKTYIETYGAQRGLAPYYNPLDPRVQQAVFDVTREFVSRYQNHPSFRGLALELGQSGYLILPGLEWGYDAATVARFEKATGVRVPVNPGKSSHQQRYEYLTMHANPQWIRWRCAELARFHLQLARLMTAANPDAHVYFSGHRLFWKGETDTQTQPLSFTGGSLDHLLPQKGLDFSRYAGER